jgi:hypothetical protein
MTRLKITMTRNTMMVIRGLFLFPASQNKDEKNRNSAALNAVTGIKSREGIIRKPAIHNEGAAKSFS